MGRPIPAETSSWVWRGPVLADFLASASRALPHFTLYAQEPGQVPFLGRYSPTQHVRLDEDTLLQRQSVVAIYS